MRGYGDYTGLDKYFDSDDEIPDKNKPKKQENKPKVEPASNPKYQNNFFQQYVKHQIEQNQPQRNPQVARNQKPQKNPSYTQKIQNNEQRLNQLLFQKTMKISNIEAKCANLEKQLQTQKEINIALQGKITGFENLIAAKELSVKDYQEQIDKLRSQIDRIEKKRVNTIENKELHSLMDQMLEESKAIRSKMQALEKQYGKYYKILKVMKEEEIQEVIEIMDHYQSQMRDCRENFLSVEPMRWQLIGELRQRCEFLENIYRKSKHNNFNDSNQMKRMTKDYDAYLWRYASEVRKVEEGLNQSDYELRNLLSNFSQ